VTCDSPSVWDEVNARCISCPEGSSWNAATKACDCPRATPFVDPRTGKCAECPYDKPIWNGRTCVACPAGTNYDVKSKTCTVCPEGLIYNAGERTCTIA
jgi:hypothetical protein